MKRVRSLLLCLLTALALCACNGGAASSPSATVNMEELQAAMLAADPALPEMKSITGDAADAASAFPYFSGMDYSKVENFLLSYSAEGKADEIAVIAVKDPADVREAADSLTEHKENRLKLFRQYSPDQVSRAERGIVFTQDQYAVLIISEDPQAVRDAFAAQLG